MSQAPPSPPARSPVDAGTSVAAGLWLTVAALVAALGNFGFQVLAGPLLDASEFGLLNASLAFLGLLVVPFGAAGLAVAHLSARHYFRGNHHRVEEIRRACLAWLRRHSAWFLLGSLAALWPLGQALGFGRPGIYIILSCCLPLMLWAAVAQQWLAGTGRFQWLGGLNFVSVLARLATGLGLLWLFPFAEAGLAGSAFGAAVFAVAWLVGRRPPETPSAAPSPSAGTGAGEFKTCLFAAIAVGCGITIFTTIDILAALRHFGTDVPLGIYAKAGLLARAVLWGAYPVLQVYFTRRSAAERMDAGAWKLLGCYAALGAAGLILLLAARDPLARLMCLREAHLTPGVEGLLPLFARAVVPLLLLQALGIHLLAARRYAECVLFGFNALAYGILLVVAGRTAPVLLSLMAAAPLGVLIVHLMAVVVRHSWRSR